jgi:hypothetical protein
MSSGSTDADAQIVAPSFGRAGFIAAMVNIAALEFVCLTAWSLVLFLALAVVVPVLVANAVVAYFMTRAGATTGRIGRGMLVACATAVVTQLLVGAVFLVTAVA